MTPKEPARILIVDDQKDGAETFAELLRALCDVVTEVCTDARQARACVERFRPTVAVLDIGMPHINGYELAREIRQIDGFQDIRLIALTGYGAEADRALTRAAGFEHHLVKPVEISVFRSLISAL